MSNFQQVSKLNTVFGKGVVGWDWDALKDQFHLITEEFKELHDALEDEDKTAVALECADLLVVAYGLLHRAGVDADKVMDRISESNFSKLCTSAEELSSTVTHYASLGVSVEGVGEPPEAYVRVTEGCTDLSGRYYPKGKFLKSLSWERPNTKGIV